jgi:nicotinate-nucleotide adenylyltransferase
MIGLFGGTFDPIHFGHIKGALHIKKLFSLDEIIFIPSANPPHKDFRVVTDISHRLNMLKFIIKNYSQFSISDIEIKRCGKSYTIDTILHFKSKFQEDTKFLFLIGYDAFMELHTWKNPKKLLNLISFIVMPRPLDISDSKFDSIIMKKNILKYLKTNFSNSRICFEKPQEFVYQKNTVFFAEMPIINISSNKIRSIIKNKDSADNMTFKKVIEYIKKKGLYV